MLFVGKTNIIYTNNNLKFTIHNILLFPVALKVMFLPEQSHLGRYISRNSYYME